MPFGLVYAPATFQHLMEFVFVGVVGKKCLDDIIILGRTVEEHNHNLIDGLERLRAAGLRLKPKKCKFAQLEVDYLGHVVSKEGVRSDSKKLEAVREFPTPTCVKTLRSFLGLASYYRRFIANLSKVTRPLHTLNKKVVSFVWTPECELAFKNLKALLTGAPVLAYPDFTRVFLLETDAWTWSRGYRLGSKTFLALPLWTPL